MRIKVLVEGSSDAPVVEEILRRKFGMRRQKDFVVIHHRGKGRLPADDASPQHGTLLYELPKTFLNLDTPASPSLRVFLRGVEAALS